MSGEGRTGVALRPAMGSAAIIGATIASLIVGSPSEGLFGGFLALLMITIAAIDAREYIIPDPLSVAAAALGGLRAYVLAPDDWPDAMVLAALRAVVVALPLVVLLLVYRRWRGRDGIGLGDIKLVAVAGVWLSITTVVVVVEIAALSALAAYFAASHARGFRPKATASMPFGLFLAPAIWFGWLVEALVVPGL